MEVSYLFSSDNETSTTTTLLSTPKMTTKMTSKMTTSMTSKMTTTMTSKMTTKMTSKVTTNNITKESDHVTTNKTDMVENEKKQFFRSEKKDKNNTTLDNIKKKASRHFDGWSFFGGIILAIGISFIVVIGIKYYRIKTRTTNLNYNLMYE